jgi:hypothetical protein
MKSTPKESNDAWTIQLTKEIEQTKAIRQRAAQVHSLI